MLPLLVVNEDKLGQMGLRLLHNAGEQNNQMLGHAPNGVLIEERLVEEELAPQL